MNKCAVLRRVDLSCLSVSWRSENHHSESNPGAGPAFWFLLLRTCSSRHRPGQAGQGGPDLTEPGPRGKVARPPRFEPPTFWFATTALISPEGFLPIRALSVKRGRLRFGTAHGRSRFVSL